MARKTKEEVLEEYRCASIQDAAMRVISRKGMDGATIQDIADEAGVAKGTVYVYFRDREELLAKTADRLFENLLTELQPAFDAEGPFAGRLHGLVLRQLRYFDRHRALFRATMALSQREAQLHKPQTKWFVVYMTRLQKMFTDAHERGEIRDLDPHAVSSLYRDCVRGAILRRLDPKAQKSRGSAEHDADFIVSVLLRGIDSGEK